MLPVSVWWLVPIANRRRPARPPVVRFRRLPASPARLPVVRFRLLRGRLVAPSVDPVPVGLAPVVLEARPVPVVRPVPAVRVVRPVPAVLVAPARPPAPVALPVRICRAVPAAVIIRASRCRAPAFVLVDPAAPVGLVAPVAAVDPVAVVPVVVAAPAAARRVRSVSQRASAVGRLRSSLPRQ